MSLVISFLPGKSVSIGGKRFTIEWNPPSLVHKGERAFPVTNDGATPLPGVRVRLAFRQPSGHLALDFEAPREFTILRHASGDVH
jgi:hypothetical protein